MQQSASLECESLAHNHMSKPIIQKEIWNFTLQGFVQNATVLVGKVIVMTQGTRCDGIINCYGEIDEKDCGSSTLDTFFIGNIFYRSSSHIIKNYFSYKYNMKNNSSKLFNNYFYVKLTYLLNLSSAISRSAKS